MSILEKSHSCTLDEILPDGEDNPMEHSYSRDNHRPEGTPQMGSTRTIMVQRPIQCPSCHIHTDEGIDIDEPYNPPLPTYNEENAKIAMEDTTKVAKYVKNTNSEDVDWEEKLNQFSWTPAQVKLFTKISSILDSDRMARLENVEKPHGPVQQRVIIDKSVDRFRKAFGNISWDAKLTQWIHNLLLDNLPPSYMAAYLDILQTMRAKVPTLVEKMLYARPGIVIPELMAPVLKDVWEPVVTHKNRKLPGQPFIVVVPSGPNVSANNARIKKWYSLFATMASVVPIQSSVGGTILNKQSLQTVAEHMVAVTRAKMLEIRNEAPNRPIILVGFNVGASLALQVGLVENVSCIVCIGFAYNTVYGERGAPDDHILDVTTPIQFVVGQNAARSSSEEIENLREKMIAQTSLVVVGSADDSLRVSKTKRKIEGFTQTMVDNMVMDEIAEFATTCLVTPPEPKASPMSMGGDQLASPTSLHGNVLAKRNALSMSANVMRKRKLSSSDFDNFKTTKPVGRPRKDKILTVSNKVGRPPKLQEPCDNSESDGSPVKIAKKDDMSNLQTILTSYEVPSKEKSGVVRTDNQNKTVMVSGSGKTPILLPLIDKKLSTPGTPIVASSVVLSGNQFIQLKAPTTGAQKIYTVKTSPKTATTSTAMVITTPSTLPKMSTPPTGVKTLYKTVTGPPATKLMNIVTSKTQVAQQSQQLQQQRLAKLQTTNLAPKAMFSPTKYTIVKQTTTPVVSNSNMDLNQLFDKPFLFADNDGIIQDKSGPVLVTHSQQQQSTKLITLQTTPKTTLPIAGVNRNIIIQNSSLLTNKNLVTVPGKAMGNKIVLINKSAIPQTGLLGNKVGGQVLRMLPAKRITTAAGVMTIQNPSIISGPMTIATTSSPKIQPTTNLIYRPVTTTTAVTRNLTSIVTSGNKLFSTSIIKPTNKVTTVPMFSSPSTAVHHNTIIVKSANPQFKQLPQTAKSGTVTTPKGNLQVQPKTATPTTSSGGLQIAPTKAFGSAMASQIVQKQLQQQQPKTK